MLAGAGWVGSALERDYVRVNPRPNAQSVIDQLPGWFDHYNEVHPHRALRYRSPREFIAQTCEALSGLQGATTVSLADYRNTQWDSAWSVNRWHALSRSGSPLHAYTQAGELSSFLWPKRQ